MACWYWSAASRVRASARFRPPLICPPAKSGRGTLGFDLAQLELGDCARVVTDLLHVEGLALRIERTKRDLAPPVDRLQLEIRADDVAGERIADRVAPRFARRKLGARRFGGT